MQFLSTVAVVATLLYTKESIDRNTQIQEAATDNLFYQITDSIILERMNHPGLSTLEGKWSAGEKLEREEEEIVY